VNMWRWWPRGRQESGRSENDPISREKERALKLFGDPPAERLHPYAIDPVMRPMARPVATAPAPQRSRMTLIAFGITTGVILGALLLADDPKTLLAGPRKVLAEISGATGYVDCVQVRLVGAAPLKKGDKGYSRRLDVDGDGVACEPIIGTDDKVKNKPASSDSKAKKPKHW